MIAVQHTQVCKVFKQRTRAPMLAFVVAAVFFALFSVSCGKAAESEYGTKSLSKGDKDQLIQILFPVAAIRNIDVDEYSVQVEDGSVQRVLAHWAYTCTYRGTRYDFTDIRFLDDEARKPESGKIATPPKVQHPAFLAVVSYANQPPSITRLVLSEQGWVTEIGDITLSDAFGLRSPQLSTSCDVTMVGKDVEELKVTQVWYDLVIGTKLFSYERLIRRTNTADNVVSTDVNAIEFLDMEDNGIKEVKVHDSRTKKVTTYRLEGGVYRVHDVSPETEQLPGTVSIKEDLKPKPSRILGRIVDEEGKAVVEAKIQVDGYKFEGSSWDIRTVTDSWEVKPREDGSFDVSARHSAVEIRVHANGYHDRKYIFDGTPERPFPDKELKVVLSRIGETVDMAQVPQQTILAGKIVPEQVGTGVSFPREPGYTTITIADSKEKADVWFEAQRDADNKALYHLKISLPGRCGIQPGPQGASEGSRIEDQMGMAPETGYKQILAYDIRTDMSNNIRQVPASFYITFDEGMRYGKLWGFEAYPSWHPKRPDNVSLKVLFWYSVQLGRYGTRSLEAKR